ncbi:MAG: tetratricopeptide repeat protein [Leptolyngbya sp. RL_3_1]|nr:tetratricopeptide repeat protein [Leptolyngbya sp. RL_3_1]
MSLFGVNYCVDIGHMNIQRVLVFVSGGLIVFAAGWIGFRKDASGEPLCYVMLSNGEVINLEHMCGQSETPNDQNLTSQELSNRGLIRSRNKDFRGAYADLSRAVELDPDNFIAHLDLATVQSALGEPEEAIVSIERAQASLRRDGRISDAETLEYSKAIYYSEIEEPSSDYLEYVEENRSRNQ